jgi:type II secretory pathway pseudopilin PulG
MPVTHVPVLIADASTYTVKADNSGCTHWLPDLTSTCTITPPTPKAGLWFEFAYAGAAADAQNWVINTGSDTNYFKGGVVFLDTDAADTGDEVSTVYSDGNSNSKFTVVTPGAGTRVRIECYDGTTWYINGTVVSATVPTMADQ